MARPGPERVDPCPCTNPERTQFGWLSRGRENDRCVRKGKSSPLLARVNCDLIVNVA